MHQALLFRQLTSDVILFLHIAPRLTYVECAQLTARGISVVDGEVECLDVADDQLTGVRLRTGRVIPRQALVVGPRVSARTDLLASLGIEVVTHPMGVADYVEADVTGSPRYPGSGSPAMSPTRWRG